MVPFFMIIYQEHTYAGLALGKFLGGNRVSFLVNQCIIKYIGKKLLIIEFYCIIELLLLIIESYYIIELLLLIVEFY